MFVADQSIETGQAGVRMELPAKSACEGLLPFVAGDCEISEITPHHMSLVAPYKGQEQAVSVALQTVYDLSYPAVGKSNAAEGARILWFARGQALLIAEEPNPSLSQLAAVTDISDGWCIVELSGSSARDVLARLTPLDLRTAVFDVGHTARSELKHMMASITRVSPETYQVMVFRSLARTLVHDLKTAMEAVAARG